VSLRALSARAEWRDTQVAVAAPLVEPEGGELPAGPGGQLQKAEGALTDSIPVEVVGPYTAIVAIIVANTSTTDTLTALRWWTYGVAFAFIVAYIVVAYFRNADKKRVLPWIELIGALIAFGARGLARPGSPLTLNVHGRQFAIASALIAIGGAALLGLFSLPMNAKTKKAG
jgi:hypothetical protein